MLPISAYMLLGIAVFNTGLFLERHWRMYRYTFDALFISDPVYRWSNILVPLILTPITLAFVYRILPYLWIPVILHLLLVFVIFGKLFMNLIWFTNTANILGKVRSIIELLIHIYIWYVLWPIIFIT